MFSLPVEDASSTLAMRIIRQIKETLLRHWLRNSVLVYYVHLHQGFDEFYVFWSRHCNFPTAYARFLALFKYAAVSIRFRAFDLIWIERLITLVKCFTESAHCHETSVKLVVSNLAELHREGLKTPAQYRVVTNNVVVGE